LVSMGTLKYQNRSSMPVLNYLGVGKASLPILFALFAFLFSGTRALLDCEDHISLLQGRNVAVQLGESDADDFSPVAVGGAQGTANATNHVSHAVEPARALSSWKDAAGTVSMAVSVLQIKYLIPVTASLAILSLLILGCIPKHDKKSKKRRAKPVSLNKQTAEALCVNTIRLPTNPAIRVDLSARICPTVIMPSREARFVVPLRALSEVSSEGYFDIHDLFGNKLFWAAVRQANGGRKLMISMAIPGSTPRASIGPGPGSGGKGDELELCGPGNQFFGTLQLQRNGTYSVIRGGQTVMVVAGNPKSPRPELEVLSADRQPLASITCTPESHDSVEYLEIRSRPNADAVLILCCVFAVVLLF